MLIFVLCGCLAAISAQEVEEEVTTPVIDQASVDQLKREASAQCSYRHSTNIYSVTEAQCRNCVSEYNIPTNVLTEENEKAVYRITYECRPMRSSKEYLRKLCRSSSLPDRQSLDAYANCDSCLAEHGVKENGTTFDEFVSARKACIRVGHRVRVLTSYFGGSMRQTFKYNYDYELLRERTRDEGCTEHFDEQIVSKCQTCLDELFLWHEAPIEKVSTKMKSCLPPLSFKEVMAKTCRLLEDPTLKDIFQPRDLKTCHACFNESKIEETSTSEEKLSVSFACLPPADPTGELQAALCRKIEGNSVLFKDSETDQPRDLCNSWVAAQNLSVGISYADYKKALQEVSNKLRQHISAACSTDASEKDIESCKACVDVALSKVTSVPWQIRRWDFVRSFRCIFASRHLSPRVPQEPPTTRAPDNVDVGLLPNSNEDNQNPNNAGNPRRIASDF